MVIDQAALRRSISAWLETDEGQAWFDSLETSFSRGLVISIAAFLGGLLAIALIVTAPQGVQLLWSALSGRCFRPTIPDAREHPGQLTPIVVYPLASADHYAMTLGTFDVQLMQDTGRMNNVLLLLTVLHGGTNINPDYAETQALMRENRIVPNRRRRLPDNVAGPGEDLRIFDMLINDEEFGTGPGGVRAALATEGDEGGIAQIPWHVFEGAVQGA